MTDGDAAGHVWQEASCVTAKTCEICGSTEGGARGHSWLDADFENPKTCTVCQQTEGERLVSCFETMGVSITWAQMDMPYDYVGSCLNHPETKTLGKLVFSSHRIFEGNEDYEAVDGYQWHTVEYTVSFSDDQAWNYGTTIKIGYANYNQTEPTPFGNDTAPVKTFSVSHHGTQYDQCAVLTDTMQFNGWKGRTCTYTGHVTWRVPEDYDGFILIFYDYYAPWEEGMYFYEFMDENTLYFRFDNAEGLPGEVAQSVPIATEPAATEPPVTEPVVTQPTTTQPTETQPPATEPPATEPPTTEPPVKVNYVPEGCTYILTDGTKLQAGEPMPEVCTDGDELVTEAYTYKYGWQFGDDLYGDRWFADADFNGWGVGTNNHKLKQYPQLLSYINGEPVVDMCMTFALCTNMTVAPEIPSTVTNLSGTFAWCMLTEAPVIPSGVTDMSDTFLECRKLKTPPVIPSGVVRMYGTFECCSALTTAPTIPSSVKIMESTFTYCGSLTGEIEINASPSEYADCFKNTYGTITLTGSCPILAELAATAEEGNVTVA